MTYVETDGRVKKQHTSANFNCVCTKFYAHRQWQRQKRYMDGGSPLLNTHTDTHMPIQIATVHVSLWARLTQNVIVITQLTLTHTCSQPQLQWIYYNILCPKTFASVSVSVSVSLVLAKSTRNVRWLHTEIQSTYLLIFLFVFFTLFCVSTRKHVHINKSKQRAT